MNLPWFSRMRVPLLDLSEQYRKLAEPIRKRIDQVLASQRFILGPNVEQFEKAICRSTGAAHAIGVSSGTDALLAVLMALGIGPGDAVITTAYSFFATAGCIARVGATPLFVDIDPVTYNISPQLLAEFLRRDCQRRGESVIYRQSGATVRAIVPVHLFGLCCEMDSIHRISEEFQLGVIEDAAQAIGAQYPFRSGTRQAGTMGEVGCFSFYPSKNLGAAGDAGLVVCRKKELAEKIRVTREHGMQPCYYHHFIGGNFRLDEIQAAILDVKLPYLNGWSATRRAAADFYREGFERAGLTDVVGLPAEPYRDRGLENHHIYHQYVIRTKRRDELRDHLTKREIGTAIYYPLGLHEQKCFSYLGYKQGALPETERAARETLALPIYPEISREAQSYVVDAMAEFFS
jgi:dTDP-4-amino-4,6-dideoxygalactose transaminase